MKNIIVQPTPREEIADVCAKAGINIIIDESGALPSSFRVSLMTEDEQDVYLLNFGAHGVSEAKLAVCRAETIRLALNQLICLANGRALAVRQEDGLDFKRLTPVTYYRLVDHVVVNGRGDYSLISMPNAIDQQVTYRAAAGV